MKVEEFYSVESAIASIVRPDKDYILVSHYFKEGKEVKPDTHENANEWIIIFNGQCSVTVGGERKIFEKHGRIVHVVHVPKNIEHSFKALSNIYYFVIRDEKI